MAATVGLVLIVDDDHDVRSVIRDVLTNNGYLVVEAGTGAQAKQLVVQHEPDLILLDLGLPDMSGLDVLRDFTGSSATPVIVISGRAGETHGCWP